MWYDNKGNFLPINANDTEGFSAARDLQSQGAIS